MRRFAEAPQGTSKQRADSYVRDIRKLPDGKIEIDEWAHHMLRHFCGKQTTRVMCQLSAVLELAIKHQRGILDEIHEAFEAAGPMRRNGRLGLATIVELYGRTLRPHCALPVDEEDVPLELKAFSRDDRAFARDISQSLDIGDDTNITHADFMACFLGRRRQEVQLNIYDLSKGRAQQLSRWLPIPELDGLWHSGLVVFGWEYFYCGDVICALPGRTIFGPPCKNITLGHTLRQRAELHQFIVQEIKPAFTRDKYDTLNHNCNHFSDRLCGWLGCKRLPKEILQQHVKILEAPFAKAVWPILNHVMGGSSVASSKDVSSLRCHSVLRDSEDAGVGAELGVHIDDTLSDCSADL
uniref:PPPDE domain-containing protein n=1 Tax=Alexandrium andersonii TaxID=327968 RepID=A0A7S2I963_9DINO